MPERTLSKLTDRRKKAEREIQERIDKGQQLYDRQIDSEDELDKAKAEFKKWSDYNTTLLSKLFGDSSIADELDKAKAEFKKWSDYNTTLLSKLFGDSSIAKEYEGFPSIQGRRRIHLPLNNQIDRYRRDVSEKVNDLEGIRDRLELYDESSDTHSVNFGTEVFIVHGRDDGVKETVARFVEQLGLKATILHEQPSGGQTIIEKLEKYADRAGFAIVLLTPDDVGALKDKNEDESQPRARQNVVFELGYFIGKLGRERVCPLFKGEIEKPSDIDGVIYVPMEGEGWKLQLGKEMKNAGFPVDMNKI